IAGGRADADRSRNLVIAITFDRALHALTVIGDVPIGAVWRPRIDDLRDLIRFDGISGGQGDRGAAIEILRAAGEQTTEQKHDKQRVSCVIGSTHWQPPSAYRACVR